jgi:hypothetical protein
MFLYVKCRTNTNIAILWKTAHTKGKSHRIKEEN